MLSLLAICLIAIGGILAVITAFWYVFEACRVHILWGLAVLLIPGVSLVFLFMHWDVAKKPFLYSLLAMVLVGGGAVFAMKDSRIPISEVLAQARINVGNTTLESNTLQQELDAMQVEQSAPARKIPAPVPSSPPVQTGRVSLEARFKELEKMRMELNVKDPAAVQLFNEEVARFNEEKKRLNPVSP